MKAQKNKIIAMLCLIIMIPCFTLPTSANSRAQEWYGTDASGVVFKEGNVPIEVEKELLTFDIPTLPYVSYRDAQSFLAYDSKFTAEYTFYNPTDMTITATLLFPFGTSPEYALLKNYNTGETFYTQELQKYGVYVNGEKIDTKVRHTNYTSGLNEFNAEDHMATMLDDFVEDEFYHPDLTVTKYSYEIVGQKLTSAFFNINIDHIEDGQKIVVYKGNLGGSVTKTGGFSMSNSTTDHNEKATVCFYVFGKPLSKLPEASWYQRNGADPSTVIDGRYTYLGSESMTLQDFLFAERNEERGISDVDWYNACITKLKEAEGTNKSSGGITHLSIGSLMRWYEYEITLAPGEKITNAVTAPIYPEIEAWNQPYKYHYTYLLSPASGWADFGNLDIVINTPYEMITSNVEGFEKTESGYRLSRQGLPMNDEGYIDLHFTLESDGSVPKNQPNPNKFMSALEKVLNFIASIFVIIFVFIVELISSIFHK